MWTRANMKFSMPSLSHFVVDEEVMGKDEQQGRRDGEECEIFVDDAREGERAGKDAVSLRWKRDVDGVQDPRNEVNPKAVTATVRRYVSRESEKAAAVDEEEDDDDGEFLVEVASGDRSVTLKHTRHV